MNKKTKSIFYSLIIIFILLIISFIIFERLFIIKAILGILFLILGIFLIIFARKEKKKLKFFSILTGISAIAPLLGSILHNLFYALAIKFENLKLLFETLHAGFFIIALVVAPITFVIGVIGILFISLKKKH